MEKINQDISVSQDSSRKQLAHSNGVIQKFHEEDGKDYRSQQGMDNSLGENDDEKQLLPLCLKLQGERLITRSRRM